MIHIPVSKEGRRVYQYYVCTNAHDNGWDRCPTPSIPAVEIECFVVERLIELGSNEDLFEEVLRQTEILWQEQIESMKRELNRLQIHQEILRQGLEESDRRELRATIAQLQSLQIKIADAEPRGVHHHRMWKCPGTIRSIVGMSDNR